MSSKDGNKPGASQVPPAKKDKQKVIGVEFDKVELEKFLDFKPGCNDLSEDFHVLLKAYRGLPVKAFIEFLAVFQSAGRNVNAKNTENQTFLDYIVENVGQPGYSEALVEAGATHGQ